MTKTKRPENYGQMQFAYRQQYKKLLARYDEAIEALKSHYMTCTCHKKLGEGYDFDKCLKHRTLINLGELDE